MKYFQKASDWAATAFASPWFLILHMIFWGLWMVFATFDPYPFNLLTLTVSLESILLSGLLLNATNRTGIEDRKIMDVTLKLDHQTHTMIREIWEKMNNGD